MKTVAVIPFLLGSTRIPNKNLTLVDGFPLVFYVANACKESGAFDEIYINTEHPEMEAMANWLGVKFYLRAPERGGSRCTMVNSSRKCEGRRCQIHDHFLYDFIENVPCDYLFQVHTTSPLLKPETIKKFSRRLVDDNLDSLFSVVCHRHESFVDGKPVNFDPLRKLPTQMLSPIQMISWGLTGWNTASYCKTYNDAIQNKSEVGPTFCGRYDLFEIDLIEALDADNWDDLRLIESCLQHRRLANKIDYQRHMSELSQFRKMLSDLEAAHRTA